MENKKLAALFTPVDIWSADLQKKWAMSYLCVWFSNSNPVPQYRVRVQATNDGKQNMIAHNNVTWSQNKNETHRLSDSVKFKNTNVWRKIRWTEIQLFSKLKIME